MTRTTTTRRWIRRGAALAAVAGGLAVVPAMAADAAIVPPPPQSCDATRVQRAEIVRTTSGPAMLVSGITAGPSVDLRLIPEDVVFVQQPDYWNYFVVDCASDAAVVKTPYTKLFRVPTAPVGRYGISIQGIDINLP
jgi:hypothetical protein